jgi:hypothetical protein
MATIHREIWIDVPPEAAWDALRDIGALHDRLARGFVVETELEPGARLVTFANGLRLREHIVAIDEEMWRLVWAAESDGLTHHNGAAQIFSDGTGTRFVWIADLLPDEAAREIASMMGDGLTAIRRTLETTQA